MLDHRQRLVQRAETELQAACRYAVFARERLERQANALRHADRLLVEPVPARTAQLEVGREVERNAFIDCVLQVAVQVELESRIETRIRLESPVPDFSKNPLFFYKWDRTLSDGFRLSFSAGSSV